MSRDFNDYFIIIIFMPWYFIPKLLKLANVRMNVRNGCDYYLFNLWVQAWVNCEGFYYTRHDQYCHNCFRYHSASTNYVRHGGSARRLLRMRERRSQFRPRRPKQMKNDVTWLASHNETHLDSRPISHRTDTHLANSFLWLLVYFADRRREYNDAAVSDRAVGGNSFLCWAAEVQQHTICDGGTGISIPPFMSSPAPATDSFIVTASDVPRLGKNSE